MAESIERQREPFAHILWIGGPPDGGKTSIAASLAQRHEPDHFARADPARHPELYAAHPDRMGPEERWLGSSPEEMARRTIACWSERCDMALDDLRAMPRSPMIVAEGPGFSPVCIAPLLADRRRAIWLLPAEGFKCASVIRRDKLGTVPLSDLARGRENLIRRDLLLGEQVRREVAALGLTVHEIDDTRHLAAMIALVEARFAPWLAPQP